MKFGNNSVLNLTVFDENGNKVAHLDTLKKSNIHTLENQSVVVVRDALLDEDLLKFIGRVEENNSSDYEKSLSNEKSRTTITFNNNHKKKCRLIGKGFYRQNTTGKDIEFTFEVPNATISTGFNFEQSSTHLTDYHIVFEMNSYNDQGDLFKIHM